MVPETITFGEETTRTRHASDVTQIMKSDVSFEVRAQGDVDVINIRGQLDSLGGYDVIVEFRKMTDARHYRLVLNLQEVDYIGATAIGAIVSVAQQVRKHKGDLKVFGLQPSIRRVFGLVGASKAVETFETEQEALNSFS